jgi:O-antigen biosynthesis protein WbqP
MYKYFKRIFDFLFSLLFLLILFIPMIFVSILLVLTDGFPIFFKSKKVGQYGKHFTMYKFRSMKNNAPKDVATKDLDSKLYITKFGKIIRRFSIDELPQLINILNGTMSFIGPRPSFPSETDLNKSRVENGVLKLKPGLSGLAQVRGRDLLAQDNVLKAKIDKEYLENISFLLDLRILFMTIFVVVLGIGYKEGD